MRDLGAGRWASRLAVGVLLVVQLYRGFRPTASEFERSYWLVTYEYGFVRRGLGGELLRRWPGGVDEASLLAAVHVTSWLPATLLAALTIVLVAREDGRSHLLALLLAASPVTLLSLLDKHRPDQFGFAILIAFVLAGGRRWAWALASLLLGAAVLVHEGSLVMFGLFAVPLLVRTGRLDEWLRAALFLVPSGLAALAVLAWGRASPSLQGSLLADPQTLALLARPADPDYSILPYLGDTLADSVGHVTALPPERLAVMVAWGVMIAAIHLVWFALARVRPAQLLPWLIPLAGLAFLHVTGVDWLRWTASALASALVVLASPGPDRPVADPSRIGPGWWVVALYLATRPTAPSVAWRTGWEGFWSFWLWPVV